MYASVIESYGIAVRSDVRGRGIGSKLLAAVIDLAAAQGIDPIIIFCQSIRWQRLARQNFMNNSSLACPRLWQHTAM